LPLLACYIVPHPPIAISKIGKDQTNLIQSTIQGFRQIANEIAILKPESLICISPHGVVYYDYFQIPGGISAEGSFAAFHAPQVIVQANYDTTLRDLIIQYAQKAGIAAGLLGETDRHLDHGVMVPLMFINEAYQDYQLVRLSISGMTPLMHYAMGKRMMEAITASNKNVVLIASGDLSHKLKTDGPYGYHPSGPLFDQAITNIIRTGDFLQLLTMDETFSEEALECGLRSFITMAGAFDGWAVATNVLSYEGPFGVGYMTAKIVPTHIDEHRHFDFLFQKTESEKIARIREAEDEYVKLARKTLETYVLTNQILSVPLNTIQDLIDTKAGVFVSIKKEGRLRGCIGTIEATKSSIAEEIIHNAIASGTQDPRFDAVIKSELAELVYSVDVLSIAEPIPSKAFLNPLRYGVIVSNRFRSGLLLPNLEGIDTVDQQIEIALKKARIKTNEEYALKRFEVIRHH